MAQAYVPSLDVIERTLVRRERRLPLKGTTNVKLGDRVNQNTIVASTELPGKPVPISAAVKLGVPPNELKDCMTKNAGDQISQDEQIGIAYSFFGLFKTPLISPITGTIDSISNISGQIILREAPIPVQVNGYISGKVVDVEEGEAVSVETDAALIQGIFGIGGEKVGELVKAVPDRDTVLTPDHIRDNHKDKILIAGNLMTHEAIEKARKLGVLGIIGGGLNDQDLKVILGYDLGVAITGNEDGPTLVVTEGFGSISMGQKTFELLTSHEGRLASINGATQIRAGVIRPEVIIPLDESADTGESIPESEGKIMEVGSKIRIIRNPNFGAVAEIIALPHEQTLIPTGARVRVATIKLEDGTQYDIPRANIEILFLGSLYIQL